MDSNMECIFKYVVFTPEINECQGSQSPLKKNDKTVFDQSGSFFPRPAVMESLAFDVISKWEGKDRETLNGYLERIGLNSSEISSEPSFEQIKRLVISQLKSVPFETLDTHFGIRVSLAYRFWT